ncbi:UNVERIFIED_CONTAM: hypothetical protein GTU68_058575 [Idotea baltica]|nr:hypothetical protein [Idotea baltica]
MKYSEFNLSHSSNKIRTSRNYFSVFFFSILFIFTNCTSENESFDVLESESLTELEINNLKFLREEEKLARDVYLYSYDIYGNEIFNNIASSEQQHMIQVLVILNKYNISDPVSSEAGVFNDSTIQKLYDDLTTQSEISLTEALKVGAFIEDFDINDLVELKSIISKEDIQLMIDNLYCGSKNHLRSYVNQLNNLEEPYIPKFISTEDYNNIINSSNEGCGK